jgi:hypothetical protein
MRILVAIVFIWSFLNVQAQDKVILNDGSQIECKLIGFNKTSFIYSVDNYYPPNRLFIPVEDIEELQIDDISSKFQVFSDTALMGKELNAKQRGFGMAVYAEERRLSNFEVRALLLSQPDNYVEFEKGRGLKTLGAVLTYPGALLVVASALVLTGPDQLNMYALGAGASAMIVGIVCSASGNSKIKNAVVSYNLNNPLSKKSTHIHFGIQSYGVGLSYHF